MKLLLRAVRLTHGFIALLLVATAVSLVLIAARTGWAAVIGGLQQNTALGLIETIGVLAVAVVALQIAQTIAEEEVVREAHVSGPTRVRRFLSRFLVVLVVALAVEALIATFKALRDGVGDIDHAALLLLAVGVLLAGWGVFVKCNCAAELLEPEAMDEAKKEDEKLGSPTG